MWTRGGGGGGGHSTYTAVHTRDHKVFRTHPKQVLSIGQIDALFKYFRVLFLTILPPKQV